MKTTPPATALMTAGLLATALFASTVQAAPPTGAPPAGGPPRLELPPMPLTLQPGQILDAATFANAIPVSPADASGVVTIQIEDKLVRVHKATRRVVEVITQPK